MRVPIRRNVPEHSSTIQAASEFDKSLLPRIRGFFLGRTVVHQDVERGWGEGQPFLPAGASFQRRTLPRRFDRIRIFSGNVHPLVRDANLQSAHLRKGVFLRGWHMSTSITDRVPSFAKTRN